VRRTLTVWTDILKMAAQSTLDGATLDPVLLDLTHEAAAVPGVWLQMLEKLGSLVASTHAALLASGPGRGVGFTATERYAPHVQGFVENAQDYDNPRPRRAYESGHAGFISDLELFGREPAGVTPLPVRRARWD
jgi:hypothetical protein